MPGIQVWPAILSGAVPEADLSESPELQTVCTERHKLGTKKYGVALKSGNGRDAWVDMVQELMDALAYATQLHLEAPDEKTSFIVRRCRVLLLDVWSMRQHADPSEDRS